MLPVVKAPSARTGFIATLRGYDIYQDSPHGDAWFALPTFPGEDDDAAAAVTYPSLAALMHDIRASTGEGDD